MFLTYARVSTAEQADDNATSLATQREKTHALAKAHGMRSPYDIQHFEDAGVSGSVPMHKRPDGRCLIEHAKAGDIVIATKLDRMFRDAVDALTTIKQWREKKVDVILGDISSDPLGKTQTGQLLLTIMSGVAEFERDRISERTVEGRKAKRRAGGFIGGQAPYGFRVVGEGRTAVLEPDPQEQEIIETAHALRFSHSSCYHATKELNRRGFRNRSGKEFQITQFMRMTGPPAERARHDGEARVDG